MNILIVMYDLNDLGGIINSHEALVAGLHVLGHEVTTRKLVWKDRVRGRGAGTEGKVRGPSGLMLDQRGWSWPPDSVIPYRGHVNIMRWKEYASTFDGIIWQIPVPSKNRENRGNLDWLELYDVPVPQVVHVHDGNLRDGAPHLYAVVDKLEGAVAVHPCAYHSLMSVPLARAMCPSPQMDIEKRIEAARRANRSRRGFFSLQTFKGWKHVEDIVRAIPYMAPEVSPRVMAGGGIQWYYMTSETKTKPEFLVNRGNDPDCPEERIGERIWDVALAHGMEWRGYVHDEERERILHGARLLIDPSWSRKYAKVGDHFNRVIVDGIIGGAAPVARNFGISTNERGESELFKPGRHYFMIPYDATPREFAELLNEHHSDDDRCWEMVQRAREELLPHFDYRVAAQTFVDMLRGRPAGYYGGFDVGSFDKEMMEDGMRLVNEFFADGAA